MYSITLEWTEGLNTKQQEVSLCDIIRVGQHTYNKVVLQDDSVAHDQALIFTDKAAVYIKCLDQKICIQMGSGTVLRKGDVHALYLGSSFRCGTAEVRVIGLTYPTTKTQHGAKPTNRTHVNYHYMAA